MITSETLIILSLALEGIAAVIAGRKDLEGYQERLEAEGKTFRQHIRRDRIEAFLILFFLILGLIFQGAAELL